MPLHPKLVHLPIALAVLMPFFSAALLVAWKRGALPRRTWILAVFLQAILVAGGVAALRTGEADGERIEDVVAEARIEAHEEAAEVFLWGAAAVLALTLGAAAVKNERTSGMLAGASVLGAVAVLFLAYRTGEAGGRLVYVDGAGAAYSDGRATDSEEESHREKRISEPATARGPDRFR